MASARSLRIWMKACPSTKKEQPPHSKTQDQGSSSTAHTASTITPGSSSELTTSVSVQLSAKPAKEMAPAFVWSQVGWDHPLSVHMGIGLDTVGAKLLHQ